MVCRALITPVFLILISGCVSTGTKAAQLPKAELMRDVYAQSVGDAQKDTAAFIEQRLKEQKTFGYVQPYIPVVQEPVVRKVWVPDHKSDEDEGMLVGGHWVYLMVEGPRWFIEDQTPEAKVPVIVPAVPEQQENKNETTK